MRRISRYTLLTKIPHFRNIRITDDFYLISLYSKTSRCGHVKWNIGEIIRYIGSYIFIPVKVVRK